MAATNSALKRIEKMFDLPTQGLKKIVRDFHAEMERDLETKRSSLKMIPTYVDKPCGNEKGTFIALDLGGTNFRVLELELIGRGRMGKPASKSFVLDKRYLAGRGEALFDFIAECIDIFMRDKKMPPCKNFDLGFTFSFPVKQTGIASGSLIRWTKGFAASGVVGRDVVRLLNEAMARRGIGNVKVAALANDTVGTLVAKAYEDKNCDVGVILGTGTNACYAGKTSLGAMIINIEWGNFDKLKSTPYDRQLDEASENPGSQILEKMVSGMYLGELFRLVVNDIKGKKFLHMGRMSFKTEYMSEIEADRSRNSAKTLRLFKRLGVQNSTPEDRLICKKICAVIALRAARIGAASLAAVVTEIDPKLSRAHTVAVDGSVYEKYPRFAAHMRSALEEILGNRASRIKMALAKDGSGKGAAIIAAVAAFL